VSITAVSAIAGITSLTPNAKLVVLQLATFHNHQTGQCNPSPSTLARFTGLTTLQVKQAIMDLIEMGVIARANSRFSFTEARNPRATPIPADFWPSDTTAQSLVVAYPHHHFAMEDAVNEFIGYYQRTGRTAPDHDAAFLRNISGLLDCHRTGQVSFSGDPSGNQPCSVRSLLSGSRVETGQNDVRTNAGHDAGMWSALSGLG
jgi:Helix-turn-helix domain